MHHFMDRSKLLKLINDCLETSYDFKVTRDSSNHWDERFKLEVLLGDDTWVPIVPTTPKIEPVRQSYTVVYGRDKERDFYATFLGAGHVNAEVSRLDMVGEQIYLVGQIEKAFCNDNEIECFDLYKELDWTPWGDRPYFCKIKNSNPLPGPQRVPRIMDCCGRVLRDWEVMCPHCDTQQVYPG